MAHYTKFGRAACGHMFKHYERAKDEQGEYVKFSNINIDTDRSHLNYNLAPVHQDGQGSFVRKRCNEVRMQNRADVNVMCSWIVTAPKDLPEQEERKFFEETYKFLSNRYGEKNIVSAHVHMDEVTPHIHFAFVPVVPDKKKGGYKVSAKEAVDRKDLQTFHKNLSEHLMRAFGRDIAILNEATKEGNKSVEELKRDTFIKQTQDAREAIQYAAELKSSIPKLVEQRNELTGSVNALKRELNDLQGKVLTAKEVNSVDGKKRLLTDEVKGITYSDFLNLKMTASKVDGVSEREKKIELKEKSLAQHEKILAEKADEVKRLPLKQQMEEARLKHENTELKDLVKNLISLLPDHIREQFFPEKTKGQNKTVEEKRRNKNNNERD